MAGCLLLAPFGLMPLPGLAQLADQPPLAETPERAESAPGAPEDTLLFRSGDRLTGELERIEHGAAIFRGNITGSVTIHFSSIQDLKVKRRFAVIPHGKIVSEQNAIRGTLELRGDDLIITLSAGTPVTLKASDIEYAFDEATFERELAHHVRLFEGISESAGIGGSFVRSTEDGVAFNTNLSLTRVSPGVDFLPRRRRTELNLSENYEFITRHDLYSQTSQDLHNQVFDASLEQNEYLHSRFFLLGTYTFGRNYSQGLQAEQIFGGGFGLTLFGGYPQQLDIKTDLHRESQGFLDPTNNDVLFGQKIAFDYQCHLPGNLHLRQEADYLPAYNLPHRYSADSTTTLTVPLFRHFIGLTVTGTDNYLNVPSPGLKRNTFRLTTSITFSH